MSGSDDKDTGRNDRESRLAAALRANLQRRKAQSRQRAADAVNYPAPSDDESPDKK